MHPPSLSKLSLTPQGILLDGKPLTKAFIDALPPQSLRYLLRASELLLQVKPEDWDDRTPHQGNNVSTLTKAYTIVALANPIELDKYSPDQPRVPAGNPDGGQWTSEGGGANETSSTHDKQMTQQKLEAGIGTKYGIVKPVWVNTDLNNEGNNQVNIFIGGWGDDWINHNVKDSPSLIGRYPEKNEDTYGSNYYFTYTDAKQINALIDALPEDASINLIGHSLGGATAAQVALSRQDGDIDTLITADPVGGQDDYGRLPDFGHIAGKVGNWVNINATDREDAHWYNITNGNLVAGVGGAWNNGPQPYASTFISMPVNHAEFNTMMITPSSGSPSAQHILNSQGGK